MDSNRPTRWLGGYIRWGKKGPSFVIERWIDGKRWHVSTKCRTERAALAQLAEFEADPQSYKPERSRTRVGVVKRVVMTAELIDEYHAWMLSRPNPATKQHADKHETRLMGWMKFYRDRDIRTVPLREISEYLSDKRDLMMRVQALKAFCNWLRKHKYLMTRADDPTIDLEGPPRRAAKDVRQVAIEPERLLAVLPHLPERSRDVLILRLGTGWHGTEIERFLESGTIRRTPGKSIYLETAEGPVKVPLLATLHVKQKTGVTTNTPILYEEHLAAAERIKARGYVPSQLTMNRHVTRACDIAGVERFLNWHLRHSIVSNAANQGIDLEHASKFIDHVGIDTTRKHYRQIALPKKAIPVLRVLQGGAKEEKAS